MQLQPPMEPSYSTSVFIALLDGDWLAVGKLGLAGCNRNPSMDG